MMCQRIGFPPISIMGLGRIEVSSEIRVPRPPARMTAFIKLNSLCCVASSSLRCNFLNSGLGERDVRASLPSTAKSKLPKMTYTHLSQDERYQIAIFVKANHCQSAIAQLMNRHKSTISREMRCNKGLRGYRPKQAHQLSQLRMIARENGPRVAAKTWALRA